MEGAGMTVGGFYAHFPSKKSLVAEALGSSLRESHGPLTSGLEDKRGADWVEAVARRYLSRTHRDMPEQGCPIPATAPELARDDPDLRVAFAGEMEEIVVVLESHLRQEGVESPRAEALATLSLMVGGLTLARALKDTPLSDEVLKACRKHVAR
jgi:TetR/AcrR family transcriptional repressor of nem operon